MKNIYNVLLISKRKPSITVEDFLHDYILAVTTQNMFFPQSLKLSTIVIALNLVADF